MIIDYETNAADDVDRVYLEEVLPAKMKWNLECWARITTEIGAGL